jgi:hypothetical protein
MGRLIEVDEDYHNTLQLDSHFLECLMTEGVDNWEGFEDALIMYEEENEE